MAELRSAPAQEVSPTELSPCSLNELRLAQEPLAVLLDDLLARSVATHLEGIAPLRRSANVDRPLDHRPDLPSVIEARCSIEAGHITLGLAAKHSLWAGHQ